jgi:hypothetical protein
MKLYLLIIASLLSTDTYSATITLDFEAPLPGGLVAATHSHLATVPGSAIVTTQYSAFGVVFAGAVLLNLGSGHATSGTNALGGLDAQGRFDSGFPITITFVTPADGVTSATTDYFSVYSDLFGGSDNGALVSAYDLGGALLGTATYLEPGQNGSSPIVLSGIGQIHTVVVDATLNNAGSGVGGIQFDLISYNTPVPEPACSILLLLGAAAGLSRRPRRSMWRGSFGASKPNKRGAA